MPPKDEESLLIPDDEYGNQDGIELPPEKEQPEIDPHQQRDVKLAPEVIRGLIREQQLGILVGSCYAGKSPFLLDLCIRVSKGIDWLLGPVAQRPVILIDHETGEGKYCQDVKYICKRFNIEPPKVPDQMELFMELWSPKKYRNSAILINSQLAGMKHRLRLLYDALDRKPNALVVIDPVQMFFRFDANKETDVVNMYHGLRSLLGDFPESCILCTFNIRKRDRKAEDPKLILDTERWLQEVSGSNALLNRCDVRLGMQRDIDEGENVRVFGGFRRGEEPIAHMLVAPTQVASHAGTEQPVYGGWEVWAADCLTFGRALTGTQCNYWNMLPMSFTFAEGVRKGVPKGTLSKILTAAKAMRTVTVEEVMISGRWASKYTRKFDVPITDDSKST